MDLSLEIRGKGRPTVEIEVGEIRELTLGDAILLETAPRHQSPAHLKRLTDRHHSVARMLASGMRPGQVAAAVGMNNATVSILQGDPAFQELLSAYRGMKDAEFRTTHERLAGVTNDALDEISERFEDEDSRKKMPMATLLEVAKLGADRTGHGPATTSTQVNIHVGLAERLEQARRKAAASIPVIEGKLIA